MILFELSPWKSARFREKWNVYVIYGVIYTSGVVAIFFYLFPFFLSSSSSSSSVLPLPHLFFKDKVGRKIFNSFLSARIDLFAREYFRPFLSWENLWICFLLLLLLLLLLPFWLLLEIARKRVGQWGTRNLSGIIDLDAATLERV